MFTRVIKRAALAVAFLVLAAAAAVAVYFHLLNPPRSKAAPIRVAMTPERIARGRYVFILADCDGCHSQRDFSRFGGPVVEAGRGRGSIMPADLGLPGTVIASNITSDPETGIGAWADGEKIRAIREGISRDGSPLFPMMPYSSYHRMSDEDVQSLVAFLNTLPPVKNMLPRSRVAFPVSTLMRTAPHPVSNVPEPDRGDKVAYGRYLSTVALCGDCHSKSEIGRPVRGFEFAGGKVFRFPGAVVAAANITPDPETGLGHWTERQFLDRFYGYRGCLQSGPPSVGPEGFTIMPWLSYSQLAPEDLKAIYAYLRTVKPVRNAVETHPPVTQAERSQS